MFVVIAGDLRKNQNLHSCIGYPKHLLWKTASSTGFFYKNQWHLHHCKRPGKHTYEHCLQGKQLLLSGDSTTRQWYSFILDKFSCQQVTEKWTIKKWCKRSVCVVPSMNFTMQWLPHTLPVIGKGMDSETIHSIATFINEIDNETMTIFVIHMYAHLLYFHTSVFRDRMRAISISVRRLLQRNKLAKVLIKAPHTFIRSEYFKGLNDYFGYIYRTIMYEEFQDLHDKIVYMDQKDMTIAKAVKDLHPPIEVVQESVYQLFDYICE